MALIVPNGAEEDALDAFTSKAAAENLVLRLYSNNYTPIETSTAVAFTETAFTGYAAVTLTAASWVTTPGAPTSSAYPQVTFTSTAGAQSVSVYGYYLTRVTSGDIAFAELFTDGPYTIVNNGDLIKVTPTIQAD